MPHSVKRLYLNIAPQFPKDALDIIDLLRKTIEVDQKEKNKSINETSLKLKAAEAETKTFKDELRAEDVKRGYVNIYL